MGGSTMLIPNTTPTGIVFRNNYCTKQASWRGSSWTVKNIFELKHAQDVTVDGNIFENNWLAAQSGYAIVLTPRNQYNDNPWTVVQRVTFTNNIVRHVSSAFNILGYDNNAPSRQTNHITIRNNVLEDVNGTNWGGDGRLMLISQAADVTVDHNTELQQRQRDLRLRRLQRALRLHEQHPERGRRTGSSATRPVRGTGPSRRTSATARSRKTCSSARRRHRSTRA